MSKFFGARSAFTKNSQTISSSAFSLAALVSFCACMSFVTTPAYAQDMSAEVNGLNPNNIVGGKPPGKTNTGMEIFGGGLTKSHSQGFNVGAGLGAVPGAGTFTIKKDALEKVTWYKSRRQISIEDDGPIVTRRGGGGMFSQGGLSPATFGGSGAIGGAIHAPQNLQQAHFGAVTNPQPSRARPLMHSSKPPSQNPPATSHAANRGDGTQNRAQAPAAQAGYSNYGTPASAGGDADYAMARAREVKAKLLGAH